jgi:hypothetical protein
MPMATRLLLLLFTVVVFGCTEKKSSEIKTPAGKETVRSANRDLNEIPAGASKDEFADVPGLVGITVGSPGNQTATGHYLSGKREGTWVEYYPNGLIKLVTSYVNGEKEGLCVEFGNNNQVTKSCYYHKSQRHGEYKEYNYTTVKEVRKYVNGKIDGLAKIYYDNGKIMEEGVYKEGLRDGVSKWYNQEGKLTIQYEYRNGQLIKK